MVKLADMEFLNAVEAVPARKGSMVESISKGCSRQFFTEEKIFAAS
jgi:hypothetical protein